MFILDLTRKWSISFLAAGASIGGEAAIRPGIAFIYAVFKRDGHCTRCSKPIVITFRESKTATLSFSTETISCPWSDHKRTEEIQAQLLQVEKRTDPDPRFNKR